MLTLAKPIMGSYLVWERMGIPIEKLYRNSEKHLGTEDDSFLDKKMFGAKKNRQMKELGDIDLFVLCFNTKCPGRIIAYPMTKKIYSNTSPVPSRNWGRK